MLNRGKDDHCVGKPRISKPRISKPGISKPGISKPGISKPGISKPGISKHCVSKHCVSKHCVSKKRGRRVQAPANQAMVGARGGEPGHLHDLPGGLGYMC